MDLINSSVTLLVLFISGSCANWNDWWTYEGISGNHPTVVLVHKKNNKLGRKTNAQWFFSDVPDLPGPDFWGRLNPGLWGLCSTGRRQSPINIEPQRLLFDPQLLALQVSKARVRGVLHNTGQGIVFRLETPDTSAGETLGLQSDTTGHMTDHGLTGTARNDYIPSVNISGGPLSYSYRVYEIQLHFGRGDHQGSEHLLAGIAFPAEIQIYGYNNELYDNASEARSRAHGIAVVSIFVKVTHPKEALGRGVQGFPKESKMSKPNLELKMLTDQLQHITYKGDSVPLKTLSIHELLPPTSALITYEGSLTAPGCEETATWILLNRPLYMSPQQLAVMRKLKQGDTVSPMAPLGNNFRPPQPLHKRAIRTNIDLIHTDRVEKTHNRGSADSDNVDASETFSTSNCPSMEAKKFYQVSPEHLTVSSNFLDSR